MPEYRGIKVTVISQLELRVHPEFPHPESSQFTTRGTNLTTSDTAPSLASPSASSSDSKADRVLGRPSTISVYIPSLPGARFWIRYDVTNAEEPHPRWYYFKLFMNGRHVASWGIDPAVKPDGQVMHGLFDPSERWNYKYEGTVYKNNGTEMRPFYFSNQVAERSAADDGGLIEVRVFRARRRQRKSPSPDEFRPQDQYGIVLPSTGLLDSPEDAMFYNWFLLDPKDTPFAAFKLHYRSWDSLASLQLIPTNHPRALLFPSPSLLLLNRQSSQPKPEEGATESAETERRTPDEEILNETPSNFGVGGSYMQDTDSESGYPPSSNRVATPDMVEGALDDDIDIFGYPDTTATLHVSRPPSPYYPILSPRALREFGFSESPIAFHPPPTQEEWAAILNRPLPELPTRDTLPQHPRPSSAASSLPSLSASLLEHYDRDGTLSPSPVLGVATVVRFHKSTEAPKIVDIKKASSREGHSSKPAEVAAPSEEVLRKRPLRGIFSNITFRKHRKGSPSKTIPKLERSPFDDEYADEGEQKGADKDEALRDMSSLSLTESEWMRQRSSSGPKTAAYKPIGQTQGQNKGEGSGNAKDRSSIAEDGMDWESATDNSAEQGETDSLVGYYEDAMTPGPFL